MRQKFNAAERDLISRAFFGDAAIEWQHVTHWKAGTLISPDIVTEGSQYVKVRNTATTGTILPGEIIYVSPGHIRESGA